MNLSVLASKLSTPNGSGSSDKEEQEEHLVRIASQLSLLDAYEQPLSVSDQIELSEGIQFIENVFNSRISSVDGLGSRESSNHGDNSEKSDLFLSPKRSTSPSASIDGKLLNSYPNPSPVYPSPSALMSDQEVHKLTYGPDFNLAGDQLPQRRRIVTSGKRGGALPWSGGGVGPTGFFPGPGPIPTSSGTLAGAGDHKISDVVAAVSNKLAFLQQKIVRAINTFPDVRCCALPFILGNSARILF